MQKSFPKQGLSLKQIKTTFVEGEKSTLIHCQRK